MVMFVLYDNTSVFGIDHGEALTRTYPRDKTFSLTDSKACMLHCPSFCVKYCYAVYGTYPLNTPKFHPPHYYHKLIAGSSSSISESDSELPVQKLASLAVSHKGMLLQ